MNRTSLLILMVMALPLSATAQQSPAERIEAMLPADVATEILGHIEAAEARGLPGTALSNAALESLAKGRIGEETLASVVSIRSDLGRARAALDDAGRAPGEGEVEAAAAAMRMGVNGGAVSALASSQPSGRSMAVPMLVLGSLTDRGLPSDEALAAVRDGMAAHAHDADLLRSFEGVGRDPGRTLGPDMRGLALARGFAGFDLPVSGISVPVRPGPSAPVDGPPSGRPTPEGPGGL